jgi:ABC-type polar amino acid transport system ATPase subunit
MASGGLAVRGLHVTRNGNRILRGVDLSVRAGELCALIGSSGAGKSTVLRTLVALQGFDEGTIDVAGFALHPGSVPPESQLRPLRERIGMVFQTHALFEHLTAIENITLALVHALGWQRARANEAARQLLEMLGVTHRADALPRALSGGEAQRVAIARALAPDPALLLLDEPTSALDPARRNALGDALRRLAAGGRGLLVTTHDMDFALAHADRVVVLADGAVVEEGTPAEVLRAPKHDATRRLLRHDVD